MASVDFDLLWIHDDGQLDNTRSFWVGEGSETYDAPNVERRMYAGGNTRIVRGPGTTTTMEYRLAEVSRDDVAWLRQMTGQRLLFRDPRGRVHHGFYQQTGITEFRVPGTHVDVTLTVEGVTDA